jgi:GNAT superfamily N-acetyltransferase
MIRHMPQPVKIRALSLEEISIPLGWAKQEGWNPGLSDAAPFWLSDPKGFIGGFIDDNLVACISAVRYDNQFGFMGFYLVAPAYRGHGYGLQVWQAAMDHLRGVTCIGLDGVVAQQNNYRKSGFEIAHRNMRFEGSLPFTASGIELAASERLVPVADIPMNDILDFDAQHFPTRRQVFLHAWVHQTEHYALALMKGDEVCAYGVIRPCATGYKIGPLFAHHPDQARNLVFALCQNLDHRTPIYLDPPAENPAAITLVNELGMKFVFETARMYRGVKPALPIQNIYGITTFELG